MRKTILTGLTTALALAAVAGPAYAQAPAPSTTPATPALAASTPAVSPAVPSQPNVSPAQPQMAATIHIKNCTVKSSRNAGGYTWASCSIVGTNLPNQGRPAELQVEPRGVQSRHARALAADLGHGRRPQRRHDPRAEVRLQGQDGLAGPQEPGDHDLERDERRHDHERHRRRLGARRCLTPTRASPAEPARGALPAPRVDLLLAVAARAAPLALSSTSWWRVRPGRRRPAWRPRTPRGPAPPPPGPST